MSYTLYGFFWDIDDPSEDKSIEPLQTHLLKLMNGGKKVSQYILPSTTKFQKNGTTDLGGVYGKSFFVPEKTAEEEMNPFELMSLGVKGMRGDKGNGTTFWFADITDQTDDLFALGMSKIYKDVPIADIIGMLKKTYQGLQESTVRNKPETRLILGTVYKVEYEKEPDVLLENDKLKIHIAKQKGSKLSYVKVTRLKENEPAFKYALQISNALLNKNHYSRITREVDFFTKRSISTKELEKQLKEHGKITSAQAIKQHPVYSEYESKFKDYPLVDDYSSMKEMGSILGFLDSAASLFDSFSSTQQEIVVTIVDKKIVKMATDRAKIIKAENGRIETEKKKKEKQEKLSL